MLNAQRGLRDKLDRHVDLNDSFQVVLSTQGSSVYDHCCFAIDADGKLSDERYMIFYNQERSPNEEIVYSMLNNEAIFTINLNAIPTSIHKLVFAMSIDVAGSSGEIISHDIRLMSIFNLLTAQTQYSNRDSWTNQEALEKHHASPMMGMGKIAELREKYDLHMKVERYVNDDNVSGDENFIRK